MNAAPNAHIAVLLVHLRDIVELPLYVWIEQIGCSERDDRFEPKHRFENTDRRPRDDRRLRRIFRMHRGVVEWGPPGVALGGVVAVLVTVANRSDRPPEIIGEFRIP